MNAHRTANPIIVTGQQDFWFTVCLTEAEARALNAIFGYGGATVLADTLKHGTHYLEKAGSKDELPKLFEGLQTKLFDGLSSQLSRADDSRAVFHGQKLATPKPTAP